MKTTRKSVVKVRDLTPRMNPSGGRGSVRSQAGGMRVRYIPEPPNFGYAAE